MDHRSSEQRMWLSVALLFLSLLCFTASFLLAIGGKDNALPFSIFGFILALWATAVTSRTGVSAKDVIALCQLLRSRGR